jgi:hypothetical protein
LIEPESKLRVVPALNASSRIDSSDVLPLRWAEEHLRREHYNSGCAKRSPERPLLRRKDRDVDACVVGDAIVQPGHESERRPEPWFVSPRPAPIARSASFESLERTRFTPREASAHVVRATFRVAIAIGSTTVAICFSRASAAAAFAERFEDMLAARVADVTIFAVERDGEAFFWRSFDEVYRWQGPLNRELVSFFADGVALHEYLTKSSDLGLHAAVIARDSRAVALVGASTAGKTTTALAAVARGFALYSDERCIVQTGRVVPFLRALTIRTGGRAALLDGAPPANPISDALRALPPRGDHSIGARKLLGDAAGGSPVALSAVLLIEGRAARPEVGACSVHAGLPALLRSMLSRETGIERAARALREFRDVPLFRLTLGPPYATADAIEGVLHAAIGGA